MSGRAGVPGSADAGVCSTGLATLRRDGFASMDGEGTLLTRPVTFKGKHLFVNLDGELRAEVLDPDGKILGRSASVSGNKTLLPVEIDLAPGKPVRFRFTLTKGRLYSFWVSPDPSGASGGFTAAGVTK